MTSQTRKRTAQALGLDNPVEGEDPIGEGQQLEPTGQEGPTETVDAVPMDDIMQSLMDWCVWYQGEHAQDHADVMAAEVRRILAGEDAESVLAESAPLNGKDHTEKPFMLHGFNLQPTDFSEGWPFYASMQCTVPGTGDEFVLNCGGIKVIAALRRLWELTELPCMIKVRGKQTRDGNTVLSLVAANAR